MKKWFQRFLALFPSKLPQGMTEFDNFYKDIVEIYGVPDNGSVRFTLGFLILHLDPTTAYKPKEYFGRALFKLAANQVVNQVINEEKAKAEAKKAEEIAQQKQLAADSATKAAHESQGTSNVQATSS